MFGRALSLSLILIIAGISIGTSPDEQSLNLTRNNDIICENDVVGYTCAVDGVVVQWIVVPFINMSDGAFIFVNSDGTLNMTIRDDPPQIRHTSANPFTTVLTINSNIIPNNTEFVCLIPPNGHREQLTYVAVDRGNVLSVRNLTARVIADENIIEVSWLPSLSPDILHYVINCDGDGCDYYTMVNSTTLRVNISARSDTEVRRYNVSVFAENMCHVRSLMQFVTGELRTDPGDSGDPGNSGDSGGSKGSKDDLGLIIGPVAAGLSIVVSIPSVGLLGYCIWKKKKEIDTGKQMLSTDSELQTTCST